MELAIRIQVEQLPEGLFLATSEELPGLVAQGRTVAEALDIAIGAPCLVIERHTWRVARPLTSVRLVYPGESHKLVARFNGG